jgi:D-glycero-alpha-D-manno-heptose-7-phosphate kinase
MSSTIHARTPCRLSLGGGGTDVSPYTERFGGAVTNFAIDIYMEASLRLRDDATVVIHSISGGQLNTYASVDALNTDDDHRLAKAILARLYAGQRGLELRYFSPIPERSGLGGSSALAAAIAACFNHLEAGQRLDHYELAEMIYRIERQDLRNLGGRQDQYAAIFGGINYIEFRGEEFVRVNPLRPAEPVIESLQRQLLLFWIGDREASGGIIEEQTKNVAAGGDALAAMHDAKRMAGAIKTALLQGQLDQLGALLHEGWLQKKRFGSRISSRHIDRLYADLQAAGMRGGKITGAGGGGHMLVFVPFERRADVMRVVAAAGGRHVPYRIDPSGLRTWEDRDD